MHCEAEPIVLCCGMLCCVWWGVCAWSPLDGKAVNV